MLDTQVVNNNFYRLFVRK